jgi:cytochrome b561
LTGRPARWNALMIALHWLTAGLIFELIAHGWLMVHAGLSAATAFDLYQWHKSLGFTVLALTAIRLLARSVFASPPPSSTPWEGRLAAVVQGLLYLATIAAVLAGWLVVSTSPLPIPTRFFNLFVVPDIAGPDAALFKGASLAHELAAWSIACLVALHVAGALKHHFIDRDDVLIRMSPHRPRSRGPEAPPPTPRPRP